eukprot:5559395-Prymnesium_polylepis.1
MFQQQLVDTSNALSQNGDDAVELFERVGSTDTFQVIDTFGDPNTDGTGEPWEYSSSWAYRTQLSAGSGFNLTEWVFGGMGCTASVSISSTTTYETSCPYP